MRCRAKARLLALPRRARYVRRSFASSPATAHYGHEFPGLRSADRRAGGEDRRAEVRVERCRGEHRRRDRAAAGQEPAADDQHLLEPDAVADRAAGAASAAAVHARLRRIDLHRFPGAARRPHVLGRSRHRRRAGASRRQAGDGHRPAERARYQGARAPQLRHAEARGLSQGAAPDAHGRALPDAADHASSTPRAPIPASAPRSAARARRSRATCSRCRCCACRSSAS